MSASGNPNFPALPAPIPAAEGAQQEYSLGTGLYEQALDKLNALPGAGGETARSDANLLVWQIGVLAACRDYINTLPADVRAEREPAIQADRTAREARLARPALTWAEWEANRQNTQQELSEWGTDMSALFAEMRSHIPQDIQDERDALLAKRYAARRAKRARIDAEWRVQHDAEALPDEE